MNPIEVTLSANAGVSIGIGGFRIWVDALHDTKVPGFSTLDTALQKKMLHHPGFQSPDAICYTHCHGDHFSKALTEEAHRMWPNAPIFLPEKVFAYQHLVEGEAPCYTLGSAQLQFLHLPHEGAQYADVAHYGLLVSVSGCNILLTGDCALAEESLLDQVGEKKIHLAVVDFPWITKRNSREFLQRHFPDTKLVVCHLPFDRDDTNGFRRSAQRAAAQLGDRCVVLTEPLETIRVNF